MQAITSNPLFFPVLLTVIIILAFPLVAGYLVLVERKVLADIQVRLGPIVRAQETRHVWFAFDNFGFMLVPFAVYVISSIAETNRVPFDLPEAESELVAGYHTEYSGFRWALYMLSEYAAVFVMGAVVVKVFLGGWVLSFA